MKKIFYCAMMFLAVSCADKKIEETEQTDEATVENASEECSGGYGKQVDTSVAITVPQLKDLMIDEKDKEVVVVGTVTDVCQKKGCWTKLDRGDGESMMVTFKDYAIFMPKTCSGKQVFVKGVASIKEISVDDQKHYAEDAGKTPEEIAAINSPKVELVFEADGIFIN